MKTLDSVQIEKVSGGSCNWHDFGQDVAKGAITGGIGGAVGGASISLGTLTVPGWVAGAGVGAVGGGAAYVATCGW